MGLQRRRRKRIYELVQRVKESEWIELPGGITASEKFDSPKSWVQEVTLEGETIRSFVVHSEEREQYERTMREKSMQRTREALEKLAKLPPVFKEGGTVTAGNSSGLTDGAAALVLTTQTQAKQLGLNPLAEILGTATAGVDPKEMGLGPVPSTHKLLKMLKLSLDDLDLIEINEAFASQVVAVEREIKWDQERRNIKGGAIALGHPIGCTGAKITVTLLYSLLQEKKELGLATLCVSGGQGMSLLLKKI